MSGGSDSRGEAPALPPAGWFDDPEMPGEKRFWDGARWTEQRVPTPPMPAPGWYDDPEVPGEKRFWDGARWTEERVPAPPVGPPAVVGPVVEESVPEPVVEEPVAGLPAPPATPPAVVEPVAGLPAPPATPPAVVVPVAGLPAPPVVPPGVTRPMAEEPMTDELVAEAPQVVPGPALEMTDPQTNLVVGLLGVVGGLLLVVGLFPDFFGRVSRADGPWYMLVSDVLPAGAFVLCGILAITGRLRYAAAGLLGVTAGYLGWWLQEPLFIVVERASFGKLVGEIAGPGFWLQALGIAAAAAGGVIGVARLTSGNKSSTRASEPTGTSGGLAGWALAFGILGLIGLFLRVPLAIAVVGFGGTFAALTCGYVALGRIKRAHGAMRGRGMALAAVILGWISFALILLSMIAVFLLL